LISAKGWFKASFKDGGIALKVSFPIHTQIVNGRQIPKIDVTNFNLGFDTRKITISIGGGILADIGDLFIGLFKSTIIKQIANSINSKVPGSLSSSIQSFLVASNGMLSLPYGIGFDFQFPQDPQVTTQTIGLYLNATFFNTKRGYKVPVETPITDMKLNFTAKNYITVDTSTYTVDSALLTMHDRNIFNITITQKLLGPILGPKYLNTTFLDTILPGIEAKFGANQPAVINFATLKHPTSFFNPGEIGVSVTGAITVSVNG
jgi:hypothetical protein